MSALLDAASPFHAGERAVQARAGVRERAELVGRRMMQPGLPDDHARFFSELSLVLAGAADASGRVWATLLAGHPGFASARGPSGLYLEALPGWGDPLRGHLTPGAHVGLLGFDPATRRRNRASGAVVNTDDRGMLLELAQSFGNCPKHITPRAPRFIGPPTDVHTPRAVHAEGAELSLEASSWIARADTFFIASANPSGGALHGVDVSHRGGPPGFVRQEAGALVWVEYPGNNFFNTLGNLELSPAAGLLFLDLEGGGLLWLTGEARAGMNGAVRELRFVIGEGRRVDGALPIRWSA